MALLQHPPPPGVVRDGTEHTGLKRDDCALTGRKGHIDGISAFSTFYRRVLARLHEGTRLLRIPHVPVALTNTGVWRSTWRNNREDIWGLSNVLVETFDLHLRNVTDYPFSRKGAAVRRSRI